MDTSTRNALLFGAAGLGLIGAAVALDRRRGSANAPSLELPPLPYPTDALVPAVSAATVTEHYTTHQASYVKGYNTAMQTLRDARAADYEDPQRIAMLAPVWRNAMFNGGGSILHKLYWENLRPDGATPTKPGPRTRALILRDFGSVKEALREIRDVGLGIQGSGWVVLAYSPELRQLVVMPVGNHENGVLVGARPILIIDVWEHAYYLDRKNNRKGYLEVVLPRIAWDVVERRLVTAEQVR
jgi:Fe-Mn family superoxide dismutase